MDNPTLAEIASGVPTLVKAGIKGLSDDDRLGLTMALVEGGRMTFSEMKTKYGLNPSTLSSHLAALQRGDLVRNYYEKNDGRAYSYYEATDLPKVMLSALLIATRKMKVVEDHAIHAPDYDPWANQSEASEALRSIPVKGQVEVQGGATASAAYPSMAFMSDNVGAEERQYNEDIHRLVGNTVNSNRSAAEGA